MGVATAGKPPFRAEVIGSLLRPRRLKDVGRADGCAFEWPTCVASSRIRRRAPIAIPEFERANDSPAGTPVIR